MDEDAYRMLQKHDQDLYRGNGKPALTVRMAIAEKDIENMQKAADEIRGDSKAIKLMVLTTLLAIAGDIIVKLVMH